MTFILSIAFSALLISTSSPKVVFTYCPNEPIETIDETLEFDMYVANSDIINFFVSVTQNGELYSRFYIDTDFNPAPDVFELPKAKEVALVMVWKENYGDKFSVFIEIIDEDFNAGNDTYEVSLEKLKFTMDCSLLILLLVS